MEQGSIFTDQSSIVMQNGSILWKENKGSILRSRVPFVYIKGFHFKEHGSISMEKGSILQRRVPLLQGYKIPHARETYSCSKRFHFCGYVFILCEISFRLTVKGFGF